MKYFIQRFKTISVMSIALWCSVIVHIVLISLHFKSELHTFADKLTMLDVTLVNTKSNAPTEKTDSLAQANMDGGGNTEVNHDMKSIFPSIQLQSEITYNPIKTNKYNALSAKIGKKVIKEESRVKDLEKQAKTLLTQINAINSVESQTALAPTTPDNQTLGAQKKPQPLDLNAMSTAALEIDKLEAIIAKQQDEYQKRPKRKFVGARAKEYKYALYVENWRQKVEKIGNLNYPDAAKNQKLYGKLQMTVSIKADGSVEEISVNQSSGHQILDDAAKRIVYLGAPYAAFSDDIRREIDILSITRMWTFTKDDAIATE